VDVIRGRQSFVPMLKSRFGPKEKAGLIQPEPTALPSHAGFLTCRIIGKEETSGKEERGRMAATEKEFDQEKSGSEGAITAFFSPARLCPGQHPTDGGDLMASSWKSGGKGKACYGEQRSGGNKRGGGGHLFVKKGPLGVVTVKQRRVFICPFFKRGKIGRRGAGGVFDLGDRGQSAR